MSGLVGFALCIPLISFASAGMLEFQKDRRSLRSLGRALPLSFAVVVSLLLLIDVRYPYVSLDLGLKKPIAALSLLVAFSAFGYRSRVSAALIFIGGLMLAVFWGPLGWVT